MTTMPSMATVWRTTRMASTAAPSAPSLSPRPIQRAPAMAAASVTRTSSMPRLRSGAVRSAVMGEERSRGLYAGFVAGRDEWQREFDRAPRRDADFETMSGVPLEPVYGPDDGELPGQFPYTRGPHASMYRSKLWTMRLFAG